MPDAFLFLSVSLYACSGPWLRVRHVPEDGFAQTINYEFNADVYDDEGGRCRMMVVRVRALNKVYSKEEPPPRLELFDDDCNSPLRFERVQYISMDTGEQVRLHGAQVVRFLADYAHLMDELVGWLWRAGVIAETMRFGGEDRREPHGSEYLDELPLRDAQHPAPGLGRQDELYAHLAG